MFRKFIFLAIITTMFFAGKLYSAKFDKYRALIKAELDVGFTFGRIMDEERNSWTLVGIYEDGTELEGKPSNTGLCIKLAGEILWKRFGFNLSVGYMPVIQEISVGGSYYEKISYSGTLISSFGMMAGINYYLLLAKSSSMEAEFYFGPKIGYLWGKLYPNPTLAAYDGVSTVTFDLNGMCFGGEIGFQLDFGGFLTGLSFSYYYNMLNSAESLLGIYTGIDKSVNFRTLNIGLFIGLGI